MKQFILLFAIMVGITVSGNAQTYLEHLQQHTPGLGNVTVTQSKAIDELVNGKANPQDVKDKNVPQGNKDKNIPQNHTTKTSPTTTHDKNNKTSESQKKLTPDSVKKAEHHEAQTEKPTQHETPVKKTDNSKEENETPVVDMRKKVMRQSYKVTGYRVQAYAGGNSRNDRLKAEQIGNAIKMKYPDQPVYVHFYSPRWICRIGNYRSLAEAQKMLAKVRAMGYKQACLVKGKITVQN